MPRLHRFSETFSPNTALNKKENIYKKIILKKKKLYIQKYGVNLENTYLHDTLDSLY